MKSAWPTVIVIALVALISVLVLRGRTERAEAEVLRWHAVADSTAAWARDTVRVAEAELKASTHARQAAEALAAHAAAYTDTVQIEVERVRLVAVPDTCRHVVAQRDSLLNRYANVVVGWRTAYDQQVRAGVRLHRAYAITAFALDSVSAVLDARPRPRSRWRPELRPGVFAGACTDGRACAGIGISLTWRF